MAVMKIEYDEKVGKKILHNVALYDDTSITEEEVKKHLASGALYHDKVQIMAKETFENVFQSLIHKKPKYMLIEVNERDINQEIFDTLLDAQLEMQDRLHKQWRDSDEEWEEFKYVYDESGNSVIDECQLGQDFAWSNWRDNLDWKIVAI